MYQVRTSGKDWDRYIVLGKVLAIWGSHVHLHPSFILILYILCVRDRHHFARVVCVSVCVCVCVCVCVLWREGVEKRESVGLGERGGESVQE